MVQPRSEIGPAIDGLTENPPPPGANEDLTINAEITPRIGAVAGATLYYRVGFGSEREIAMVEAGGGSFRATIPSTAYEPDEMLRW